MLCTVCLSVCVGVQLSWLPMYHDTGLIGMCMCTYPHADTSTS